MFSFGPLWLYAHFACCGPADLTWVSGYTFIPHCRRKWRTHLPEKIQLLYRHLLGFLYVPLRKLKFLKIICFKRFWENMSPGIIFTLLLFTGNVRSISSRYANAVLFSLLRQLLYVYRKISVDYHILFYYSYPDGPICSRYRICVIIY